MVRVYPYARHHSNRNHRENKELIFEVRMFEVLPHMAILQTFFFEAYYHYISLRVEDQPPNAPKSMCTYLAIYLHI